ncbi:MAG TPA: hypothetical protein VHB77_14590 [Planctomycetaceae bacterium]|nr:hypothetical protein [Planctomycetaceae bacterium]
MSIRHLSAALLLVLLFVAPGLCQTPPKVRKAGGEEGQVKTEIDIELLTGNEGVGLRAQEWARVFEQMQLKLRIRSALPGEEPGLSQKMIGTSLRSVKVTGWLERDGTISFPGRNYSMSQTAKFKEWINELKTYGAQGAPEGKPLWGLSPEQFEPLYTQLSAKLDKPVQGLSLDDAVTAFQLPRGLQVTPTVDANKTLSSHSTRKIRQEVEGLSKGTALAIVLNEFDLGFRPRRTPAGAIELALFPLDATDDVWPIGWPLPKRGADTVPVLYKLVKIDIEEGEPLADILDAASGALKLPIFLDDHGLKVKRIDLNQKVTHKAKQTTWSLALKHLAFQAKLRNDLWMDEAGKPFLWISPLAIKRKQAKE